MLESKGVDRRGWRLLRHIIEGNGDRIEAIRPENIRSSLRDSILYELAAIDAEQVENGEQQQA